MQFLRQSTAATVELGQFVDSTDGATAETALTISQADIRLSKNGAAFAQTNNTAGATHMENGYYSVPLDATDTNTVGRLKVAVSEAGALGVWRDFQVLEEAVFDALYGASAAGYQVPIWSSASATVNLSATTIATLNGHTPQTGDNFARLGAPAGASVSADVAAVKSDSAAILADTGTDGVVVAAASKTGYALSSAGIQAIWDALTSALTTAGSVGKLIVDNINATISSRAPEAGGNVADIKAKTDSLTFTTAGKVDSRVDQIRGSALAAEKLERAVLSEVLVTVDTGSSTTAVIASSLNPASAVADQFKGRILIFSDTTTTAALRGQATEITAFNHSTQTFTVTALTTSPASGDTAVVV